MSITEVETPTREQVTVPVQPMNPVDEILAETLRAFESGEVVWIKDSLGNGRSACLTGGLQFSVNRLARRDDGDREKILSAWSDSADRVRLAIKDYEGYSRIPTIPRWNDRKKTTLQDVIAVLRRAILG